MRVFWTEKSEDQLDKIYAYIALDSPFYARQTLSKIISQAEKAAVSPLSGRIVPEMNQEEIREVFHHPYRIIYYLNFSKERIEVLSVLHQARDFNRNSPLED
jgi:toxin ParE1/3/4